MIKIVDALQTVVIWRVYHGLVGLNLENPLIKSDTVDGRIPAAHLRFISNKTTNLNWLAGFLKHQPY